MKHHQLSRLGRGLALSAIAVAIAFGAGQAGTALAATPPIVCVAAAPAPSMNCVYHTGAAVAAGGTMKLAVTNPAGVTITAVSGNGACAASGLGTPTATLSCPFPGVGLPNGTPLQITFSSNAAPLDLSVTANANGPITGIPAPTIVGLAACGAIVAGVSTCNISTNAVVVSGGTLDVGVFSGAPFLVSNVKVLAGGVPASLGSCSISTALPTPVGIGLTIDYTCGAGQSIPSGAPLGINVQVNGLAPTVPSITLKENANGPTVSVPSPTQSTASFVDPAGLVPATATLACGGGAPVPANGLGLTLSKFGGAEHCTIAPKTSAGYNPVADGVFHLVLVNNSNNAVLECNGMPGCVVVTNRSAIDVYCGTSAPAGTIPNFNCQNAQFAIESALSYEIETGGMNAFPGVDLSGSGVATVQLSYTSTPGNGAAAEELGTFQFVIG